MDFLQLEDEVLRDDNTSYTSSIATTNSTGIIEDGDDLHLGAEANSFGKTTTKEEPTYPRSPTNRVIKTRNGKYCNDSLIIMKHVYCSMENTETDVTYSSISSMMDIFNARECDADEILTSLGFANCRNEMAKRDILSRFKASPLLNNEDNHFLDVACNGHVEQINGIRPQYKQGINKTQEWLALHHNQDNHKDKNEPNKSLSSSGFATKKASASRASKWKRFPKSRQSSFELLLPNLKEEDTNQETESSSLKMSTSPIHPPIRESSLEIPHMTKDTLPDQPQITQVSPLHPLPIINTDENVEQSGSHQLTDEDATHADVTATAGDERKLSRLLKTSLLVANQRDSFELEEINSCNGDTTECNRQRRPGVAFLTIDSNKQNGAATRLSPNSEGGSENESSSGFGEDEILNLTNHVPTSQPRHHVSPHTVVESIQTVRGRSVSLNSPSVTTQYVYDVELGGDSRNTETPSSVVSNPNLNNNAHGASFDNRFESSRFRSKSSNALLSNYVPLRSSNSWQGFGKLPEGFLVTPLSSTTAISNKDMHVMRKPRTFFSDARRRRKEFAERSALSGDSITELVSSSLVRHNGSFVIKKRRPGHFRYSASTEDLFAKQNNVQDMSSVHDRNLNNFHKQTEANNSNGALHAKTWEGNRSVKTIHEPPQSSNCSNLSRAGISNHVNSSDRDVQFVKPTDYKPYAVKHSNGS